MLGTCLMYSCGIPKERKVTVSDVEITGFMKDYVKVVDGTYSFTNNGKEAFITVKFELIKNANEKVCRKKHPEDVRINPIGKTGEIFDTDTYGFTTSREETSKLKDLINTGKVGDTKSISFKWKYFGVESSKSVGELIFKNTTSFEIIGNTFNFCSKLSESDLHWDDMDDLVQSSTKSSDNRSDSGNNWDKALDEYENFVKSYNKILKKVQEGDMSAITEYPTYMQKATSFAEKFSNAQGVMNAAQMSRYIELTEMLIAVE